MVVQGDHHGDEGEEKANGGGGARTQAEGASRMLGCFIENIVVAFAEFGEGSFGRGGDAHDVLPRSVTRRQL